MNIKFEKWTNTFRATMKDYTWPAENLIRMMKGEYIPGLNKDYKGKKVIDIGFGDGRNLIFLASLEMALYGVEVTQEICDMAKEKRHIEAELRVGTNQNIPFSNDEFDYLVSWNVVHYGDNESDIANTIKEYARVLKRGGRFFLSTPAPDNKIIRDGITLGHHRYQVTRKDDFRVGQVFFYFDSPNYIRYYFEKEFKDVLVGRAHDDVFTDTVDLFLVTGVKK